MDFKKNVAGFLVFILAFSVLPANVFGNAIQEIISQSADGEFVGEPIEFIPTSEAENAATHEEYFEVNPSEFDEIQPFSTSPALFRPGNYDLGLFGNCPLVPGRTFNYTRRFTTAAQIRGLSNSRITYTYAYVDFRNAPANLGGNTIIRVGHQVRAIVFEGNQNTTFTGLRIIVEGYNTNVAFRNFNFNNQGNVGGPALYFSSVNANANAVLASIGTNNNISGRGAHDTVMSSRALFIVGNANLTVDHVTDAASGSDGRNAITVSGSVYVDLHGVALRATGGVGRNSTDTGAEGTHFVSGTAAVGGEGGRGGNGGNAIFSTTSVFWLNILGTSRVNLTGGAGGRGANGGEGGIGRPGINGANGRPAVAGTNGLEGGTGGRGGNGGFGGWPLRVYTGTNDMLSNFIQHGSFSYIRLQAGMGGGGGNGGRGGIGGPGGNGGNGQTPTSLGAVDGANGGNGGWGGNGGAGGDAGSNGRMIHVGATSWDWGEPRGQGGRGGAGGNAGRGGTGGTRQGITSSNGRGGNDGGPGSAGAAGWGTEAETPPIVHINTPLSSFLLNRTNINLLPGQVSEVIIPSINGSNTENQFINWISSAANVVGVHGYLDARYRTWNVRATATSNPSTEARRERIRAQFGQHYADLYVTVFGHPSVPQNLNAILDYGSVTISWQPPLSDGGTPITAYRVQHMRYGGTWGNQWVELPAYARSHTFRNLTNGERYVFRVRAVNAAGNGVVSPERTVTLPVPNVTFNPTGGSVTPESRRVGADNRLPSPPPRPMRYNYDFQGWFTSEVGGTRVEASHAFPVSTTIYARWNPVFMGSGTAPLPFRIYNADDLVELSRRVNDGTMARNAHYVLMGNISLDGIEWIPIGTHDVPFAGTFDGGGYKITELNINRPDDDYVGLFGYVGVGATIKNLGLENATVFGGQRVGALVGFMSGGTIERSHVSASVRANGETAAYAGGLVGEIDGSVIIRESYAQGDVEAFSDEGRDAGNRIAAAGGLVGGLRGRVWIENSFATGIGVNAVASSISLPTNAIAGGLVGRNNNVGTGIDMSARILNSYSTAIIVAIANGEPGRTFTGALIGIDECSDCFRLPIDAHDHLTRIDIVEDCFYLAPPVITYWPTIWNLRHPERIYEQSYGIVTSVGRGLSEVQMRYPDIFWAAGWDSSIWDFSPDVNNGFPFLRYVENPNYVSVTDITITLDGETELSKFTMSAGEEIRFTASVFPSNATRGIVFWYAVCDCCDSENPVAVAANGLVLALRPGTATIRARSIANPSVYAEVEIIVYSRLSSPRARLIDNAGIDGLLVELWTDTPGAIIRYTTDGTNPNESSRVFTPGAQIPINIDTYIKAQAFYTFESGYVGRSPVAGFLFTVRQTEAPVASWTIDGADFSCIGVADCSYCAVAPRVLPFGTIISFRSGTPSATIRYNAVFAIGNSEPSVPEEVTHDSLVLTAIRLDRSSNIRTQAFHSSRFYSREVVFNFQAQVAAPIFLPTSGAALPYNAPIAIVSTTPGATIRFTTDGSEPNEFSEIFSSPIPLHFDGTTIRARAFLDGCVPSDVSTATFTLSGGLPIDSDSNPDDTIGSGSQINLFSSDTNLRNTVIRYEANAVPTSSSPVAWHYAIGGGGVSMPVTISEPVTIYAGFFGAVCGTPLSVAKPFSFHNVITAAPTTCIASGSPVNFDAAIPLRSMTDGAQIRFTTDGSFPNINSRSDLPISLGEDYLDRGSVLVRAIAFRDGLEPSEIVSFAYTVTGYRADRPRAVNRTNGYTIEALGTIDFYSGNSAFITYTINGGIPDRNSRRLTGAIMIPSAPEVSTIRLRAFNDENGLAQSLVAEYTFHAGAPEEIEINFDLIPEITFPSDSPILPGFSLGFDIGGSKAQVAIEDDRIKVVIGFTAFDSNKDLKSAFDETKRSLASPGGFMNMQLGDRHSLTTNSDGVKVSVVGYFEAAIPRGNEPFELAGRIGVTFEASFGKEFMIIPLTVGRVEVGTGISLLVGAEWPLSGDWLSEITFSGNIGGELFYIELRAGIGLPVILNVGFYGRGSVFFNQCFGDYPFEAWLQGEFGTYQRIIFVGTFKQRLWDGRLDLLPREPAPRAFALGKDISEPDAEFYIAPRNHLGAQSPWLGNRPVVQPFAVNHFDDNAAPGAPSLFVLQQSIYDQTAPLIAEANGNRVMVFLADDGSRGDMNRTTLMYSIYEGNGVWSEEPRQVDNDNTADLFPNLASDGNNIWVTWHNSREELFSDATLECLLANAEIAVAKFNGDTFMNVKNLTGYLEKSTAMNTMPQIAISGETVAVAWMRNARADGSVIIGVTCTNPNIRDNEIVARIFTSGIWGEEISVASGLGAISDMTVGFLNGEILIAYIEDGDNSFDTIHDRNFVVTDLYGVDVSTLAIGVLASSPAFAEINGQTALSWFESECANSGGNIRFITNTTGNILSLFNENDLSTDTFRIISNNAQTAIVYPHIQDGAGSFLARTYDNGWSAPFVLAHTGGYSEHGEFVSSGFPRFFDAIMDSEGNFHIAYNNSHMAIVNNVLIESNDLNILQARPLPDIHLVGVVYANEDVRFGENLPVTAIVENTGGQRVDNVAVYVNGGRLGIFPIAGGLHTGGVSEISFEIAMPPASERAHFVIRILPEGFNDFDERDNSYTLTPGAPLFTLSLSRNFVSRRIVRGGVCCESEHEYEYDETGPVRITAIVENEAYVPANANIIVRRGSLYGEILDVVELGEICALQQNPVSVNFYVVPYEFVTEGEAFSLLFFEVVSGRQEIFLSSAMDFAVIHAPHEVFGITLTPAGNTVFETVVEGYGPPEPHIVIISNSGNRPTGALSITLSGENADSFVLSETSVNNMGMGQTVSFAVAPENGLPLGMYTATVTVSGANISARSFDVSFTVQSQYDYDISALRAEVESTEFATSYDYVTNIAQARAAVEAILNDLYLRGVTAVVIDGYFTAAIPASPGIRGINGSYTFTIQLSKGAGTPQTTDVLILSIVAAPGPITVIFDPANVEITDANLEQIVTVLGTSLGDISVDYDAALVPNGVTVSYDKEKAIVVISGVRPTTEGAVVAGSFNVYVTREGVTESFSINANLTSTWMLIFYAISFDANGGMGAPARQAKIHDTPIPLSNIVPSRYGYTFLGWATDRNATVAEYLPGVIFSRNENITLYAVWRSDSHAYPVSVFGTISVPTVRLNTLNVRLLSNGVETEHLPVFDVIDDEITFAFHEVTAGTYTIAITKAAHTDFTINDVEVGDRNVDLRHDTRIAVQRIELVAGDISGTGYVTECDLNIVTNLVGEEVANSTDPLAILADLDGNGWITISDLFIVINNMGRGPIVIN
ncbi:MAG: chitobiase/beta-hexosaminidase C-terminal domain-containing protein [Defluviitaleaceae bacterium]|nr:chitobiase/beta-hexosaminidase C-terminal domain-containing protein [Defluviitaleaceae bacterium]MCL2263252.1 chitobiase/beta-hexosaminidase C-terminal domain-containing protein [Defluviitaleaceae bacterium]